MALERLAPLHPERGEGGEPTPPRMPTRPEQPSRAPQRTPTPSAAQRAEAQARPTRQDRAARAEGARLAAAEQVARDPTGFARQVCLQLLEVGPRTRRELAAALAAKGLPAEAAEEVLGRFAEVGLIDDALFASLWVSSRHRGRGLAGRALAQELRRKGIDDETVREAVGQLAAEDEEATARGLVRRKLAGTRGLPTQARVRRLAGMLARKGYGAGLAFRIVKEELDAEGCAPLDVPFEALQALDDG